LLKCRCQLKYDLTKDLHLSWTRNRRNLKRNTGGLPIERYTSAALTSESCVHLW
jgi:hypothetical protein